jgi:hypothetical protein
LLQFFKPENYADVREALTEANRPELIGDAPECLIPSRPPKQPVRRKPASADSAPQPTAGYRPHRKTAGRRN